MRDTPWKTTLANSCQLCFLLTLIEPELAKRESHYALLTSGTGLNLTAADTLIHYDPWWNQATDRTHRIGQDKQVFVYRLVAVGMVELTSEDLDFLFAPAA